MALDNSHNHSLLKYGYGYKITSPGVYKHPTGHKVILGSKGEWRFFNKDRTHLHHHLGSASGDEDDSLERHLKGVHGTSQHEETEMTTTQHSEEDCLHCHKVAEKYGYKQYDHRPDLGTKYKHPGGHVLHVAVDGGWSHYNKSEAKHGEGSSSLHSHLADIHGSSQHSEEDAMQFAELKQFHSGIEHIATAEKIGRGYISPRKKKEDDVYTHSWTGAKIRQDRLHGGRFEVSHTSASGWHVFDHKNDTTVSSGHKDIHDATNHAKAFAKHYTTSQHSEGKPEEIENDEVVSGHVSAERAEEILAEKNMLPINYQFSEATPPEQLIGHSSTDSVRMPTPQFTNPVPMRPEVKK